MFSLILPYRRLRTDPDYDEEKCIDNVIEASITEELHNDDQSAMQKAIAESLCQLQPGGYEDDDSLLQSKLAVYTATNSLHIMLSSRHTGRGFFLF